MKALEILNKLVKELKSSYACTLDFDRWTPVNSNFEVMHESIAYCIDYSITGNRQVKSTLSVMKPDIVDGRKTWFKCGTDKDFRLFIETSINQLLPILFDERLQEQLDEEAEQDRAIEDYFGMRETLESLSIYR